MANIKREATDVTLLLREAIAEVLLHATEPLAANEIAERPPVATLGVPDAARNVFNVLTSMYKAKPGRFSVARTYKFIKGTCNKWGWYDPKRLILPEQVQRTKPVEPAAATAACAPPEFRFDPIELETPPEPAAITMPAGAKSITISVAGVSIRIDLQS